MELLFAALPVVGCAAVSVACHRVMSRRGGCHMPAATGELAALRAEVADLRADGRERVEL